MGRLCAFVNEISQSQQLGQKMKDGNFIGPNLINIGTQPTRADAIVIKDCSIILQSQNGPNRFPLAGFKPKTWGMNTKGLLQKPKESAPSAAAKIKTVLEGKMKDLAIFFDQSTQQQGQAVMQHLQ